MAVGVGSSSRLSGRGVFLRVPFSILLYEYVPNLEKVIKIAGGAHSAPRALPTGRDITTESDDEERTAIRTWRSMSLR